MNIEIDRDKIARYLTNYYLILGLACYGVGIIIPIIMILLDIPRRQANEYKYWVENQCIKINMGLYFRKQKSIPFDMITDVMWHQGPVMRRCNVEGLRFQTAGSPQAEGTMIGVKDAQTVRDQIMTNIKESKSFA